MKNVVIYTTPTCHFCHMSKEFFKEHDIPFTEHDVARDLEHRKEMVEKSGQMGVPVIFVDSQMIIGFDKKTLSEALGVNV